MTNEERIEANNATLEECIALAEELPDGRSAELAVTLNPDETWILGYDDYIGIFETDEENAAFHELCGNLYATIDTVLVETNYDSIYTALQNGSKIRLDLKGKMSNLQCLMPFADAIISYFLTPVGLVAYGTFYTFVFINGSYHDENTDPYA